MKRTHLPLFTLLVTFPILGCDPRETPAPRELPPAPGRYADVNGLRMYYEIHGRGKPLVLLHGGLFHTAPSFGRMIPSLAQRRQVVGIEQQGHGHTADIDRRLTYEQMADDTAELLRRLGLDSADVFGWSDGGVIATRLAMRYPQLVRRFAIIGSHYNNAGIPAQLRKQAATLGLDDIPAEFRESYTRVAPKPEQWPTVVTKVVGLMSDSVWRGWKPEDLRSINAPALIMTGDRDQVVLLDHVVELYRMLPHAQLAVLPGTDHFAPLTRADWIVPMILTFFDAPVAAPAASDSKSSTQGQGDNPQPTTHN